MKKINHMTIFFILFLLALLAKADQDGEEYEINPPDINDLRLPYYTTISEVYGVSPESWDVRAILINNYAYEFDKQANVLSVNGKKQLANGRPVTGHLVELYSKIDNRPVWKGWPSVYYWVNPDELSHAITKTDVTLIAGRQICPAQEVSGGYLLDIGYSNDDTQQFLNGDCHKAIDEKINGRLYKTYPPSKKIDTSDKDLKWIVQYFTDPITPLYNLVGECVLYCDIKENNK